MVLPPGVNSEIIKAIIANLQICHEDAFGCPGLGSDLHIFEIYNITAVILF